MERSDKITINQIRFEIYCPAEPAAGLPEIRDEVEVAFGAGLPIESREEKGDVLDILRKAIAEVYGLDRDCCQMSSMNFYRAARAKLKGENK